MTNRDFLDDRQFEFFDEDREFSIPVDAIPAGFGPQQTAGDPAHILVTALPALYIAADSLND